MSNEIQGVCVKMIAKEKESFFAGLDIGTSKIVTVIARTDKEDNIEIVGLGESESIGLKRGVINNIDATVESIKKSIEEAELMAGYKIKTVWTGIAGNHIRSFNSTGMVAIRDKEVTQSDINRVVETATAINIPSDQKILHVLPQEFIVDGQDDIKQPIGMSGVRLEVRVHIVTGAASAAQNIVKCIKRCGVDVGQIILQSLASANSILSEDEKQLGTVLVDMGGGTTDVIVFSGGSIRHTGVVPIAGDQVTNDIAMALRTPTFDAEKIKVKHGICKQGLIETNENFNVPGIGDRPSRTLSRASLAQIIEPRIEELYSFITEIVRDSGFEELVSSGIVMTGGTSMLQGAAELGEDIFFRQVRIATPMYEGNLKDLISSPRYSTAIGLIIEAKSQTLESYEKRDKVYKTDSIFNRVRSWIEGYF